jgi:hypothetical protein
MKYKYSTEAKITFSLFRHQITQQDEFHLIDQDNFFGGEFNSTIYLICQRPKITIIPEKFFFDKDFLTLTFEFHNQRLRTLHTIQIENPYPDASYKLISNFPFNFIDIKDEFDTSIFSGKSSYFFEKVYKGEPLAELTNFNILYIGKSEMKGKKPSSIKRLISHSTLQKVYFDHCQENPDKEIFIILCNFLQDAFVFISGSQEYQSEIPEEIERFKTFNDDIQNLENSKLLSLLEAGLIDYFKPEYNGHYKNQTFLKKKQKASEHFIKKDYRSFEIGIDTSEINIQLYTDTIESSLIHYKEFLFDSSIDRLSF